MNFTVHSHCLDIAKHCALPAYYCQTFPFHDRGEGEEKEDGNGDSVL